MALLLKTRPASLAIFTIIYAALSAVSTTTALGQNVMSFSYAPNFADSAGIATYGSVQFSDSAMWMLYDPATPPADGSNLIGRAAYGRPISFTPESSFNTSFTFEFILTGTGDTLDSPSGMTFFISPAGIVPPENSGGRYLGLIDGTHITGSNPSDTGNPFFAVEFDSTKDNVLDDPSDSHVGIDLSSVESVIFADTGANSTSTGYYPELYLCRNSTFAAWISYSAASQTTQVWMTNISSTANFSGGAVFDPPSNSSRVLSLKRDLYSSVFSKNSTWFVGFTAANYKVENPPARIAIRSWHFSVDFTGSGVTTITSDNSSATKRRNLNLIIPLAILGLLLSVLVISIVYFVRRRTRARSKSSDSNTETPNDIELKTIANLHRYSYQELSDSTHGFHPSISLIGEGGSSKVYKGTLRDGSLVAIKRLKDKLGKEAELASELRIINEIRHRNLLQLQGWSFDKGEALLVYKFMSNGSLESHIFGNKRGTLDGDTRLRILRGVANALEYLHSGLGECILHRDVKAANVLLTEDFEPILGDFGLVRLIKHDSRVPATMVGTPGYVAPEVFMTGTITEKADVYSFGVLMLEVACGSSTINKDVESKHVVFLVEMVSRRMEVGNVLDVLDPTIINMPSSTCHIKDQWGNIIRLALLCCQSSPNSRPPMRYVSQYIHDICLDPLIPPPSYNPSSLDKDDEYNEYLSFLFKQSNMIHQSPPTNPTMSSSSSSISTSADLVYGPIPR